MFADPETVSEYVRMTVYFDWRCNAERFNQSTGMIIMTVTENNPLDIFKIKSEDRTVTQKTGPLACIKQVVTAK